MICWLNEMSDINDICEIKIMGKNIKKIIRSPGGDCFLFEYLTLSSREKSAGQTSDSWLLQSSILNIIRTELWSLETLQSSSYLVLTFRAELSIRQANLSFTARVDLCSSPVPGTVPGHSVPQELPLSVLSHWSSTLPVSIGPSVVLSFSESEEKTEEEKRNLEIQNINDCPVDNGMTNCRPLLLM